MNKITYKHLREIKSGRRADVKVYPPRIQTLAKFIEESYPDCNVKLMDVQREGKRADANGSKRTYVGKRLVVAKGGKVIFDHDPTDPANTNYKIVDWLLEQRKKQTATVN